MFIINFHPNFFNYIILSITDLVNKKNQVITSTVNIDHQINILIVKLKKNTHTF